jgi:glucose/arabinose dehydrogenase
VPAYAAAPPPTPAFPEQTRAPAPPKPSAMTVTVVAAGLDHPWSLAFLPEGGMLVTERPGRMRLVSPDGRVSDPIEGLPAVKAIGSRGLQDVVLDPRFRENRLIYFSYFAPNPKRPAVEPASAYAAWVKLPEAAREADRVGYERVARARLSQDGRRLEDLRVILDAPPMGARRLIFARDGALLITADAPAAGDALSTGEAQQTGNLQGKVLRIRTDGSVPRDNPFVGRPGVRPEIYAYGFRDPQGVALDPRTGELWTSENGPRGGDEINRIRPGRNYGFPTISYGRDVGDAPVGSGRTEAPGMEQPLYFWTPSVAVSGMTFYTGRLFPDWRGDLFVATLIGKHLSRLVLQDGRVKYEEPLLADRGKRIRDVRQGPDGALYVLTDESPGELLRLTPPVSGG